MKLSRIPGHEATVKHSFAFKKSTSDQLQKYQELYSQSLGVEVSFKDVVEQMLVDFMGEDKIFQRSLRQPAAHAPAVAAPAVAAPAATLPTATESAGAGSAGQYEELE